MYMKVGCRRGGYWGGTGASTLSTGVCTGRADVAMGGGNVLCGNMGCLLYW